MVHILNIFIIGNLIIFIIFHQFLLIN